MTEELDSQLSAMFDDELPHGECELLARRLARDEGLRQRWGRYAAMRACFREEGSPRSIHIAARVRSGLSTDSSFAAPSQARRRMSDALPRNLWRPVAGIAVACGVAAVSIFWVRTQGTAPVLAADSKPLASTQVALASPPASSSTIVASQSPAAPTESTEPDSYVTPAATDAPAFAPTTELANYVVAHSEYSTPINRRSLLSSFVTSESTSSGASSDTGGAAPQDEPRESSAQP